ncbi:hypothetical protein HanXRQr2_Chr16g0759191 [Helianthus annuus]|uniref:Uncharacterized protein n=1 Tax=Helianthus annuus TaxID=4232 RepID=A0A251SJ89_HELAN|nr:hypothetical protein HanXRQr2_Chr16g0759191 [Helianthus annuus]KAJ0822054.1 hypothetical protein HanPSC8_Chr16g0727501 [Helianthus annuus]
MCSPQFPFYFISWLSAHLSKTVQTINFPIICSYVRISCLCTTNPQTLKEKIRFLLPPFCVRIQGTSNPKFVRFSSSSDPSLFLNSVVRYMAGACTKGWSLWQGTICWILIEHYELNNLLGF